MIGQADVVYGNSPEDLATNVDAVLAFLAGLGVTFWTITPLDTHTPGNYCVLIGY